MINHWLYGNIIFNTEIKDETNCLECLHNKVCKKDFSLFCVNYNFGNSNGHNCETCIHKFTRPCFNKSNIKDVIPCFKCNEYLN